MPCGAVPCRPVVFVLLSLLWIGFLFSVMLAAAQRFFCPTLEVMSEYLRLPPAVAGATLLSLGNGAPDVFTQLAAMAMVGGQHSTAARSTAQGG